jgi:hypothetical protein
MQSPIKLNIKIYQGSTFRQILRWESSTKVYVPISNIQRSAPMIVDVVSHSVPVGWRVKFTNVQGMKEINSVNDTYHIVTETTPTTLTLNQVNSLGYSQYTGGGVVEYNMPVDLSNFTGRMQIREKIDGPVIHELTTQNGGVTFDTEYSTITIFISDTDTANFKFTNAVYNLELVDTNGVVNFAVGNIVLIQEVTK